MLATIVAVCRRAVRLLCSTRRSDCRRIDQIVDAPNPAISTATITSVIFAVRRDRSIRAILARGFRLRGERRRRRKPAKSKTYIVALATARSGSRDEIPPQVALARPGFVYTCRTSFRPSCGRSRAQAKAHNAHDRRSTYEPAQQGPRGPD